MNDDLKSAFKTIRLTSLLKVDEWQPIDCRRAKTRRQNMANLIRAYTFKFIGSRFLVMVDRHVFILAIGATMSASAKCERRHSARARSKRTSSMLRRAFHVTLFLRALAHLAARFRAPPSLPIDTTAAAASLNAAAFERKLLRVARRSAKRPPARCDSCRCRCRRCAASSF